MHRRESPPIPPTPDRSRTLDPIAAAVLDDLATTRHPQRVIARYAVVRALMLDAAAPAVRDNARSAAHANLRATRDGWPEAVHLARLLDEASADSGGDAPRRRAAGAAAGEAASVGDVHGARVLATLAG